MDPNQSSMHSLGEGIRTFTQRPNFIGNLLNQGAAAGAVTGGVLGGLGGMAANALTGGERPHLAKLVGLLGAGIGAYSGHLRAGNLKSAGWRSSPFQTPKDDILQALNNSQMDFSEKARLIAAVPQLNAQQAQQLASAIVNVGSAAAGALIAKYMLGSGLIGTLLGGVAGQYIGSALFGSGTRDSLGVSSRGNTDRYGQSF